MHYLLVYSLHLALMSKKNFFLIVGINIVIKGGKNSFLRCGFPLSLQTWVCYTLYNSFYTQDSYPVHAHIHCNCMRLLTYHFQDLNTLGLTACVTSLAAFHHVACFGLFHCINNIRCFPGHDSHVSARCFKCTAHIHTNS